MTAPDSDTAGRGNTRVDLVVRAPVDTARARLHRCVSGWIGRLKDRRDQGARLIVALCRDLSSVLAMLSLAERARDDADRARRFADGRVAFTDRALLEQQQTIVHLRAELADAKSRLQEVTEKYLARPEDAGSFDVATAVRDNPVPPAARSTAAVAAQGER